MSDAARTKALFLAALDLDTSRRGAFLDRECGGDSRLRFAVEALLEAHGRGHDALDGAPMTEAARSGGDLEPGDTVGDFVLERSLGEGGFGRVFAARQLRPVQRRVALKVVKAGLDSRGVLARFALERQALALMGHEHIARVLDVGELPDGRPFFAMELIEGTPITEYCDSHGLDLDARLELFAQVCSAVQHAHSKGVVHRDVKPGNVLVIEADGKPAPRVIDFGVAKALGDVDFSATLTSEGQLVGTPGAMSPEQAVGSPDVDTRTDIWALGVLLFELLVGRAPFTATGRGPGAFVEIQRRILETDPPRPSAEVKGGRRAPGVPAKLPLELDWIVARCLEKDREKRYPTANDLALDVRRVLTHEPVVAVPPSTLYKLRKFVRRRRALCASLAILAAVVVLGTVGTATGWIRSDRLNVKLDGALARATAENRLALSVNEFLVEDLLRSARPSIREGEGKDVKLVDVLIVAVSRLDAAVALGGKFAKAPRIEARIRLALGQAFLGLGREAEALEQLERAHAIAERDLREEPLDRLRVLASLTSAYNAVGRHADAEQRLTSLAPELRARIGLDEPEIHAAAVQLATSLWRQGKLAAAEAYLNTALTEATAHIGADHDYTLALTTCLGVVADMNGEPAVAEPIFRKVAERKLALFGPDGPETFTARGNLASFYAAHGKLEEAEKELDKLLASQEKVLGRGHPRALYARYTLGSILFQRGELERAREVLEETLRLREAARGKAHSDTLTTLSKLAQLHDARGDAGRAEEMFRETLQRAEEGYGADHRETIEWRDDLAVFLYRHKRLDEALSLTRRVVAQYEADKGPDARLTIVRLQRLGSIEYALGDQSSAKKNLTEAAERAKRALPAGDPLHAEIESDLKLVR